MNKVKLITFEGKQVRAIEYDGEMWLARDDVAEALGGEDSSSEKEYDRLLYFGDALDRPALPLLSCEEVAMNPIQNRKYVQKTYRGRKVWTLSDASSETGIRRDFIAKARGKEIGNRNWRTLRGQEVALFKAENLGQVIATNRIVVINAAGMKQLCAAFGAKLLGNGVSPKAAVKILSERELMQE